MKQCSVIPLFLLRLHFCLMCSCVHKSSIVCDTPLGCQGSLTATFERQQIYNVWQRDEPYWPLPTSTLVVSVFCLLLLWLQNQVQLFCFLRGFFTTSAGSFSLFPPLVHNEPDIWLWAGVPGRAVGTCKHFFDTFDRSWQKSTWFCFYVTSSWNSHVIWSRRRHQGLLQVKKMYK